MNKSIFLFYCLFLNLGLFAQSKYWVFFTDKEGVEFNPYEYFDEKAIERRCLNGVPISHRSDYPVQHAYIQTVSQLVDSTSYSSRWLNALAVYATNEQKEEVSNLSFVKTVIQMPSKPMKMAKESTANLVASLSVYDKVVLQNQTTSFSPQAFYSRGISGKGVRVAVFDAGFPSVDSHKAFAHLRKANKIVATYDFVSKRENVYGANSHGCQVLSNIVGKLGDTLLGLAPDAEVMLARTEKGLVEVFSEEENWVAALEWADKNGADIVNSSLGYTNKRYFTKDMDGKTALVSRAANMAASKGIIVVNAAGNDGDGDWYFIGAPADADSIISVGGVSPYTHARINFSSLGPTADLRMKPNVSAYAYAITAAKSLKLSGAYGTSFSSPLLCGFVACAKQAYPSLPAMELISKIYKSAHLYPYYDYGLGFGIPQADHLLGENQEVTEPTFELKVKNNKLQVEIPVAHFDPPEYFESIGDYLRYHPNQLLFYHVENQEGFLSSYSTVVVETNKPITKFDLSQIARHKTLRIHYRGYTQEVNLKELLK